MPTQHYMANPEVTCRQEPEGAALFNPESNDLLALNAVGYLIWQILARPGTQPEIVAHLLAACQDVPAGQVAADVADFLQVLVPRGFIGLVLAGDDLPDLTPAATFSSQEPSRTLVPAEQEDLRYYQGHSMADTFRPGDYLTVEPVPITAIRPGDVVIYRGHGPAGEPTDVVHRVVAVTAGGLVTRGDNNPDVDNDLVTPATLVGRVTHRERGGRVCRVPGGCWGLLQCRVRHTGRRVRQIGWRLLRAVGRPAYRWLRESGLARRLWRPAITRLLVTTGNGPVVQYVSGRQVVARWWPTTGSFRCRRPYDLVIRRPNGSKHSRASAQAPGTFRVPGTSRQD